MPGNVTFNLMSEGLLGSGFTGHLSITLTRDGQSLTLGQNFSIAQSIKQSFERAGDILLGKPFGATRHQDGSLSTQYEAIRLSTSTQAVSKTLVVSDEIYDKLLTFFKQTDGRANDYGMILGQNCLDFADAVFEMTGAPGKISDLFSKDELSGSTVGWLLLGRKNGEIPLRKMSAETFISSLTPKEQKPREPVSSSFAGADIVIPMLLLIVMLTRMARKKA